MDGYEFSRRMKNDPATSAIPLVALTASSLSRDEGRIREHCDGYLRKPVSRVALIAELMKFLKHTGEPSGEPGAATSEARFDQWDASALETERRSRFEDSLSIEIDSW